MLIKAVSAGHYCWICEKSMAGDEILAHTSILGDEHRFHKGCLKKLLKTIQKINYLCCPLCHERIDAAILISWEERCVQELTKVLHGAWLGFKVGAVLGLAASLIGVRRKMQGSRGLTMGGLGALYGTVKVLCDRGNI